MLFPKKIKHRKPHKKKSKGKASKGNQISFGTYAMRAVSNAWITSRQIEAARRAMTRYVQRGGKIWIRIFPDRPITRKGDEVAMGGGKGAVDHFVANVRKGRIIFEMDGIPEEKAKEAMRRASHKLPVKTRFEVRDRME